jgi:hypothetical protein
MYQEKVPIDEADKSWSGSLAYDSYITTTYNCYLGMTFINRADQSRFSFLSAVFASQYTRDNNQYHCHLMQA